MMGMVVKDFGKDEIVRYADLYTKVILTVIAMEPGRYRGVRWTATA
jgi:hypothetical protein